MFANLSKTQNASGFNRCHSLFHLELQGNMGRLPGWVFVPAAWTGASLVLVRMQVWQCD